MYNTGNVVVRVCVGFFENKQKERKKERRKQKSNCYERHTAENTANATNTAADACGFETCGTCDDITNVRG
jgi:hypothetical protein